VTINDGPSKARLQLTKRFTQEDIQRRTKTLIVTRGRFYAPNMPVPDQQEKLYLLIKPGADAGLVRDASLGLRWAFCGCWLSLAAGGRKLTCLLPPCMSCPQTEAEKRKACEKAVEEIEIMLGFRK